MRIEQAKSIPFEQFLAKLGFQPVRSQAGQLWYLSPLRDERTPSFKINTDLNLWFDFGQGIGGTIIDFAMEYGKHSTIPAALKFIESAVQGTVLPFEPRPAANRPLSQLKLELNYSGPLRNLDLKRYLTQRGIQLRKCAAEIRELHYTSHDKSYVAIGFPSDRGGYELRNRTFKGTMGAKTISSRPGEEKSTAIVFEGFFDYLTYLTLWGRPTSQVIVLNSVSFRDRAIDLLRKDKVARVELFRDNDATGEALLTHFREQLPLIEIVDQASLYPEHKDFNEWHVMTSRSQARSLP